MSHKADPETFSSEEVATPSEESASATSSDERSSTDTTLGHVSTRISPVNPARPSSTIHSHQLPQGWTCDYNSDTDEYKFELQTGHKLPVETRDEAVSARTPTIDHDVQTSRRPTLNLFECKYGYHFPTSPTPSMISDLAKQVQKTPATGQSAKQIGSGTAKLANSSEADQQAKRLKEMFPTATEPIVEQMIKIYNGREGLIKAALISLGYKRAKEYGAQKEPAKSPIMLMMAKPSSKKLFDKLVSYFPGKDETLIKNLMYLHKEVEYEIISKLVESSQSDTDCSSKYQPSSGSEGKASHVNGAIMKLRYLKFLYPTCEEIELYHLLNCNDLNTQKVVEVVEQKGHKRANIDEVLQARKSLMQKIRAQQASRLNKEKGADRNLLEAHQNRVRPIMDVARVDTLKNQLKSKFGQLDDELVIKALVAADYNESLAARFLDEMEPIDEETYTQRYQFRRKLEPDAVRYPCKAVQTGHDDFMSVISNDSVWISRAVVECDSALALLKLDASTFTQDDFERPRFTHREGSRDGLATGSIYLQLEAKLSCMKGHNKELARGSNHPAMCEHPDRPQASSRASGNNPQLAVGCNRELGFGHNPKLIQRLHPFFKDVKA